MELLILAGVAACMAGGILSSHIARWSERFNR
jgi:hypothetical protein